MQPPEPDDQSQPQFIPLIENASILTPTSGFLKAGYTHTNCRWRILKLSPTGLIPPVTGS